MAEMIGDSVKQEENFFLLVALLRDGTLNYRWRAAEALGDTGDPRAVGPLIEALSDPYVDVSWIAAKSLGKIGDPEAVPHLIAILADEDTWQRLGAVEGLGGIGDEKAVEPLVDILRNDPQTKVRKKAAWALGRIGGEAAKRALEEEQEGSDEAVRKAVTRALEEITRKEATAATS